MPLHNRYYTPSPVTSTSVHITVTHTSCPHPTPAHALHACSLPSSPSGHLTACCYFCRISATLCSHSSSVTWSTWSAVINRTSRAGKLRSTPSGPDDWHRVAGKIALAPLLSSFLSHPGTETEKMKPGRARASLLACLCAAIGTAWGALAAPRAAVRQQTPPRAFRCERARRAVTCVVWAVGGRGSGALATWSNLECSR